MLECAASQPASQPASRPASRPEHRQAAPTQATFSRTTEVLPPIVYASLPPHPPVPPCAVVSLEAVCLAVMHACVAASAALRLHDWLPAGYVVLCPLLWPHLEEQLQPADVAAGQQGSGPAAAAERRRQRGSGAGRRQQQRQGLQAPAAAAAPPAPRLQASTQVLVSPAGEAVQQQQQQQQPAASSRAPRQHRRLRRFCGSSRSTAAAAAADGTGACSPHGARRRRERAVGCRLAGRLLAGIRERGGGAFRAQHCPAHRRFLGAHCLLLLQRWAGAAAGRCVRRGCRVGMLPSLQPLCRASAPCPYLVTLALTS